jgi:hypothetical protein
MKEGKDIEKAVHLKLSAIAQIKYIDENWGQLEYYSQNPPVQWPCILTDITQVRFSELGNDRTKTPSNRQMGEYLLELNFAMPRLTNTSFKAPQGQKDAALVFFDILDLIHENLHGWSPIPQASKLIREGFLKVDRDDGIKQYRMLYSGSITDV